MSEVIDRRQTATGSELQALPEDHQVSSTLHTWCSNRTVLSYVYSRSLGGLLHVGRACISKITSDFLELQGEQSKSLVLVRGAAFGTEPQLFFTPQFVSSFLVCDISVRLTNHDWLFLSSTVAPDALSYGLASGTEIQE